VAEVTRLIEAYQFGEAGRMLYEFTWFELADWYVEAAKPALAGGDAEAAAPARAVLGAVLERTLRLLHPFIPFVTEAIWQHLPLGPGRAPALIVARWPAPYATDAAAEADFALLQELVHAVRNTRAEYEVAPGRRIPARLRASGRGAHLGASAAVLAFLARLDPDELVIGPETDAPQAAHATLVIGEGLTAWLPLAGMVDLERERERLKAEAGKLRAEVERLDVLLANESYTGRAPAAVVQRERDKRGEAAAKLAEVDARRAALG
jgi:valyl-tRNA synthetase